MGWNYEIKGMRNGYCEYPTSRVTNNIFDDDFCSKGMAKDAKEFEK